MESQSSSRKWNGIKSLFRGGRSTLDTTTISDNQEKKEEEHPLKKSLSTGSLSGLMIKIKIVDSFQAKTNDKKFVVYVLHVHNVKLRKEWKVHRRYNQFKDLNQKLVGHYGELKALFPPGKAIGRFAKDFIEKRTKMLQEYLDAITQKSVTESEEFQEFINEAKQDEQLDTVMAEMWNRPEKQGMLVKQGHFMKNWKPRWFILQDSMLFYFTKKPTNDDLPKGFVALGYCNVEKTDKFPSRPFCFEIVNNQWNDEKDFAIQASSNEELEEWMVAIRSAKMKKNSHLAFSPDTMDENQQLRSRTLIPAQEESEKAKKGNERLKNYLESTRRSKKIVQKLTSKFDIMSFSHRQSYEITDTKFITEKDSDSTIQFTKEGKIKGGTVDKLIVKMTDPESTDMHYILGFLLTYRSFTTPQNLLSKLICIFKYYNNPKENTIHPAQFRVCTVLKKWLEVHFYDFVEDMDLTNTLLAFADNHLSKTEEIKKMKVSIKTSIKKKVFPTENEDEEFLKGAPPSILPSLFKNGTFDFLDLDNIEIARQLALIEFAIYKCVQELLNQQWNKSNKESVAPHVVANIKRFNTVSFWVATVILRVKELKTRAAMIKKFIMITEQCLNLNNFSTVIQIISGLASASVHRLKKTWELIPIEVMQTLEKTRVIMAPEKNYKSYREHLHKAVGPCVPYLGSYLTDLTFIEDGNPDLLKGTELINFEKPMLLSKVIMEIQQFQQERYCFRDVPELQNFLIELDYVDQEKCYEMSLIVETRDTSSTRETLSK